MKLATNLFTKGLITDYDPLNCPNDVLTDNLNGTIITMNGSEMVLLNDMGNAKVYYGGNPVKLNDGFIPVGIKEYGGIIYIASYNPKTNKSEIGSFPSPEYEKSSEDNIKNFKISSYFNDSCNSQVLIELFNGKKVYPGDTIRFNINDGDFSNITKYDSLKKDKYELKILVEDASHNLIDITDQFKIDDNGVLANNFENIYQNKFSGKLYFSLNRSTIDRIESNLKIKFNSNSNGDELNLIFIIDYYYNCPDFNEDEDNDTNEFPLNISGLDLFKFKDDSYSSIRKIKQHEDSKYPNNFLIVKGNSDFKYDLLFPMSMKVGDDFYYPEYIESEKLFKYRVSYTVPVTKLSENTVTITLNQTEGNSKTRPSGVTYKTDGVIHGCHLIFKQLSDNIFKYEITPVLNSNCVLSNLKNVGLINFNLIGTNTIELEKWQYYVTNEYTEITTKFQEYLDSDTECTNRKLFILPYLEAKALEEDSTDDKLTNLLNNYSPYIINTSDLNTIKINDLSFGNVYYCFIYYELNNGDTKYLGGRWLLNTMYFNDNIENDYQDLTKEDIPIKCKLDVEYDNNSSDFQINNTYKLLNDSEEPTEKPTNDPICKFEDYKRVEYSLKYSNIHIKSFNIDYNNYPSSIQEPQDYSIEFNNIPIVNGESTVYPSIVIKGIESQNKSVTVTNIFEDIQSILNNYWLNIDEDTVVFDTSGTTVYNINAEDYNNQNDYHNPEKLNILINLDLSHISNNIFTAKITHQGSDQLETPIRFLCIKNGNNQNNNSCLVLNYVDDNDDSDLNFKHILVYNPNAQEQVIQELQVYKNYEFVKINDKIEVKCVIDDNNDIQYTVGDDILCFKYVANNKEIKTSLSDIMNALHNSLTNYTEATGYIDNLNNIQVFNTAVNKENNYILNNNGAITQSPCAYFKYYDNKLLGNNYKSIKGDTDKFFIIASRIYPFIDAKDICNNLSDFTKISV